MLYFIVNEKSRSGKGADIWKQVQAVLDTRKIVYQYWITEYEGHAVSLARLVCELEEKDKCLIVVGGDGTANEVINGMTHFESVCFGTIPTGSGNDLARGLGITGTPAEMLERILNCVERGTAQAERMDLGQVSWDGCESPRKFTISAGAGLDALVCKKALRSKLKDFLNKMKLGKLTYGFLTVQSLFSMDTTDGTITYEQKGKKNLRKIIYVAAMNFKAEGGGVLMAPGASATDGKLSVCSAYGIPKWRTFFCFPFLIKGKHLWIRGFDVTDASQSRVDLKKPMVLHADGEYCGEVTGIEFQCLPQKLRILR